MPGLTSSRSAGRASATLPESSRRGRAFERIRLRRRGDDERSDRERKQDEKPLRRTRPYEPRCVSSPHHSHRWLIARGYVRRMTKRARTTAVLLVAILVAAGTIAAIASTGSSSGTNP